MARLIGDARSLADLGQDLGAGLTEREVAYLIEFEWARGAEDILWRRSKLGLHGGPALEEALARHLERALPALPPEREGAGPSRLDRSEPRLLPMPAHSNGA